MTATTTRIREPAPTAPASRSGGFRLSGSRPRRLSWAALGLLLVCGSALGAALWSSQVAQRRTILVASRAIDAGEALSRGDLREAGINADSTIPAVSGDAIDQVINRIARGPIPAGTPIQQSMLAEATVVPAGSVIVGISLAAGEYPTAGLRAGDHVLVVETTNGVSTTGATPRLITTATIWSVGTTDDSTDARMFISIVVPETQGVATSNAAATNRARLLLAARP